MPRTLFRILPILIFSFFAISFFIVNSIVSASEERCKFYSNIGSIISVIVSSDKNKIERIYCIKRYPTAFGRMYRVLHIITFADIKVKSGDYDYALTVPLRYKNDEKFRQALHAAQYPKLYFDNEDVKMLSDQTLAGYHYRAVRAEYNRNVAKGVRTLRIEYVDCEYQPGPECETCVSADVVGSELISIHVD